MISAGFAQAVANEKLCIPSNNRVLLTIQKMHVQHKGTAVQNLCRGTGTQQFLVQTDPFISCAQSFRAMITCVPVFSCRRSCSCQNGKNAMLQRVTASTEIHPQSVDSTSVQNSQTRCGYKDGAELSTFIYFSLQTQNSCMSLVYVKALTLRTGADHSVVLKIIDEAQITVRFAVLCYIKKDEKTCAPGLSQTISPFKISRCFCLLLLIWLFQQTVMSAATNVKVSAQISWRGCVCITALLSILYILAGISHEAALHVTRN